MFKKLLIAASLLAAASAPAWSQAGQFPSGWIHGNAGASAGQGSPSSVTAILDRALGSTRGAILERGAGGWVQIGPGTTGKPFVSAGAGADPSYVTLGIVGGGTNCAAASGTCLDNITGFASTGFMSRTGAGTYSFTGSSGSGSVCLTTSCVMVTPTLGVASAISLLANGNAGAPVAPTFASPIQIVGADATISGLTIDTYGAAPVINMRASGGTRASKTAMTSGSQLFNLAGAGWNGTAYASISAILQFAGENWSGTANGAFTSFFTTPLTTIGQVEAMRLQGSGGLSLGNSVITTDPGAGSLVASGYLRPLPTVVGSLPTCNSTIDGARSFVTNNATALGVIGSAITSGGAIHTPVYCDGSSSTWKQG